MSLQLSKHAQAIRTICGGLQSSAKLVALVGVATLTACGSPGNMLVGKPITTNPTPADEHATSRVIFTNTTDRDTISTVVISTEGRVVSGLQSKQFTVVPVCEGTQTFQITQGGTAAIEVKVDSSSDSVYAIDLTPQQSPFRVHTAKTEHSSLEGAVQNKQAHSYLVPRFQPNCAEPEQPIATFNLNSDTLFKFDGSSLSDIINSTELNEITQFIQDHAELPMRMTVSGYTDQIGRRDYNQKLSEQRAETVAHYIQNHGYSDSMQIFGFGPTEPVVDCSPSLERNALIQCLQPNRRVTVRIWQNN